MQNKLHEDAAKNIKVGDRCEVDIGGGVLRRRGVVKFIGKQEEREGENSLLSTRVIRDSD